MNNIFHLHIKRKRSDHTNDLERFLFKYGACEWAVRVRWSEKPEVLVQLQKAPQNISPSGPNGLGVNPQN